MPSVDTRSAAESPYSTSLPTRPKATVARGPLRVACRELDTERAAVVLLRPPFDPGNHALPEQERADVLERRADVLGRARDLDEFVLQATRPRREQRDAPARLVSR